MFIDGVMKEVKMGMGRVGVRFSGGVERKESLACYFQITLFC